MSIETILCGNPRTVVTERGKSQKDSLRFFVGFTQHLADCNVEAATYVDYAVWLSAPPPSLYVALHAYSPFRKSSKSTVIREPTDSAKIDSDPEEEAHILRQHPLLTQTPTV